MNAKLSVRFSILLAALLSVIPVSAQSLTPPADLNNDGVIDFLDLELLAENYRASGALAW